MERARGARLGEQACRPRRARAPSDRGSRAGSAGGGVRASARPRRSSGAKGVAAHGRGELRRRRARRRAAAWRAGRSVVRRRRTAYRAPGRSDRAPGGDRRRPPGRARAARHGPCPGSGARAPGSAAGRPRRPRPRRARRPLWPPTRALSGSPRAAARSSGCGPTAEALAAGRSRAHGQIPVGAPSAGRLVCESLALGTVERSVRQPPWSWLRAWRASWAARPGSPYVRTIHDGACALAVLCGGHRPPQRSCGSGYAGRVAAPLRVVRTPRKSTPGAGSSCGLPWSGGLPSLPAQPARPAAIEEVVSRTGESIG